MVRTKIFYPSLNSHSSNIKNKSCDDNKNSQFQSNVKKHQIFVKFVIAFILILFIVTHKLVGLILFLV